MARECTRGRDERCSDGTGDENALASRPEHLSDDLAAYLGSHLGTSSVYSGSTKVLSGATTARALEEKLEETSTTEKLGGLSVVMQSGTRASREK